MYKDSDEAVARRVQLGEQDAFGELIERYQPKLIRYARKFLADPDDAADSVQNVFIKAYQNIQSFDTSRRFSPWIYRIAHNEFVNEIKKRTVRRVSFDIDIDTLFPHLVANETADSEALERDLRNTIDLHLAALDPKYREPLILYYLEGLDYREIADILMIPVSTVGVRLLRGRSMLKKISNTLL